MNEADKIELRRGGRVAEGAPLLREYGFKRPIEGSNPSLSARYEKPRPERGFSYLTKTRFDERPCERKRAGFDKFVRNKFERRSAAQAAPKGRRAGCPE